MFEPKKRGENTTLPELCSLAVSWTVLQCYVRSSKALSLALCKTLHFCLCLFFTQSPYIHQRCKSVSGLLWACAFHSLLPQHIQRPLSSYFLKRFPPLFSPLNICLNLQQMWLPGKLLQPKEGREEGTKQRPTCVLALEGTTNIKMQNHSILRKRSISLLEPAICTRNTG